MDKLTTLVVNEITLEGFVKVFERCAKLTKFTIQHKIDYNKLTMNLLETTKADPKTSPKAKNVKILLHGHGKYNKDFLERLDKYCSGEVCTVSQK